MGLLNKLLNKKKASEKEELAVKEQAKEKKQIKASGSLSNASKEEKTKKKTIVDDKKKEIKKLKKLSVYSVSDKILLSPLVTEKAAVRESLNQYSFIVGSKANKTQIKKAIVDIYGVKPTKVRVINMSGKVVRFKNTSGRRSDFKKAIVSLPKGKSIDIHQGV
ncbi:MAG: 50S ribosomal protein L23 [Candidatus Magasanikbacteria bacterium CG10_big_fil_rev_8_21_14_0_10_40_10]|uniref:Large ribosomal subunit protein uL23 n=1 Tax=Candidatus Magasanikbacteria bacterium CG10_big_fil_rev_8_21_14_0_10_40_10 TaxID=1974648 RepID=A0A2M6W598_9BACT|nr:MAG: 50S ribosomal protein L23 [Candidatus Magasanikbacteria bacterium CG10_big_fil_rev_8_21_14_0_10_40_10]